MAEYVSATLPVILRNSYLPQHCLLESEQRGENPNGKIVLVVASKPGVYALERAANFGVESAVVSRRDYASSADFDAALLGVLHLQALRSF